MSKHYKYDLKRTWFTHQIARIIAFRMVLLGYKKTEAGGWGCKTPYIKHDKKISPKDQKFLNGYMSAIREYSHLIVNDEK